MVSIQALSLLPRISGAATAVERHCETVLWDELPDHSEFLAGPAKEVRVIVSAGVIAMPADLLAKFPKLEIILFYGAGYSTVDLHYCEANGIAVTNVPETNHEDVADVALGLVIAAVRRLSEADRIVRSGKWQSLLPIRLAPSMRHLHFGIVGLGAIGSAVAERLVPFGGSISWWGPREKRNVPWARAASLADLARNSDVLIVTAKGDNETRGMINEAIIADLGIAGYLINVSRGFVVDEPALLAALHENRLAGAGLDVFAEEPTDPSQWRALEQVALTPHMGGWARGSIEAAQDIVSENLRRHLSQEPLLTPVPTQATPG